jgi:hypothetical protein
MDTCLGGMFGGFGGCTAGMSLRTTLTGIGGATIGSGLDQPTLRLGLFILPDQGISVDFLDRYEIPEIIRIIVKTTARASRIGLV